MFRVMKYIFGFHCVPAKSVLGFQTVKTCNLQFLIILMFFGFFLKAKGLLLSPLSVGPSVSLFVMLYPRKL